MLYDSRLQGIGYVLGAQLTNRNPSGNDSPKIRTASLRPGGTYSRRLSISAPVNPTSFNLTIASQRASASTSRCGSLVRAPNWTTAEATSGVSSPRRSKDLIHWAATSAGITQLSGP